MTPPIIIDIEASGFGKDSYPIEVGYIDQLGNTWCALIAPSDDCSHWDKEAEKLHQISRNTLLAHGKGAKTVAMYLNEVFFNQTVYTDGWFQDYIWISRLFDFADSAPHFKLEDLRTILSPYQQSIWHETKQSVFDALKVDRHRASADAQVLQLTWLKTAEREESMRV